MCVCDIGKIESEDERLTTAVFRYLSRNLRKGSRKATDEELLLETVHELTYSLETDMQRLTEFSDEDDLGVLYPRFCAAVEAKAEEFKGSGGYRRLCCVPTFVLGLAMIGRVRRHYTHASWFTVRKLGSMLGEYGGVSRRECIIIDGI